MAENWINSMMKGSNGHKALVLFLYVISVPVTIAAQPDVVLDGTRDRWPIGQRMFVMNDPSRTLTIEDVSRAEFDHQFVRSSTAIPIYGSLRSVCWLRFSYLEKNRAPEQHWLLAVDEASLEQVDVYFQRPDGSFDARRGGSQIPWSKREVAHRSPVFHLSPAGSEPVTVYIRIQTSLVMRIPVSILTGDRLIKDDASSLIPWWVYIGVLGSMLVYNTVLYFSLRDRIHIYYILYIASNGLGIGLALSRVGYEYFPDGAFWLERLIPALLYSGGFFGLLFARSFLNARKTVPKMDRLVLVVAAASGVFAVLSLFIPARASQIMLNAAVLIEAPLLVIMSVIAWRRGFQSARFVLAGWLTYGVSEVLTPFFVYGVLPENVVTRHLLMVGSTVEMLLFSLALANRINEAKKESETIRQQALEGEIHRLRNIELRQANEEILRRQDQLVHAEKMASLGELTAGVAHEIKNPLNFINNFSISLTELMDDFLQEFRNPSADNKDILELLAVDCRLTAEKIAEHGARANGIVRGMLAHASVRSGEQHLTDINQLTEEYIRLVHSSWIQRFGSYLSIQRDFELGLPQVEVVPQELGRVLLNLLSNAFQAIDEQRKKGSESYRPFVCVATHSREGRVEISIQDNGVGIPAALRGRIFEPFFTTKPPGEGVGLGLSLSYGIITKRHGGTLDFDSTEGEGTTFVIVLPIRAASQAETNG